MRILNNDGSEVEACGNAARCVGRLILDEKGQSAATIETKADLLSAGDADGLEGGNLRAVSVDMGVPRFGWRDIPLAQAADDTNAVPIDLFATGGGLPSTFSAVNVGNPHAIFWVADVNAHEIERTGPLLEHHPLFPERANISLCMLPPAPSDPARLGARGGADAGLRHWRLRRRSCGHARWPCGPPCQGFAARR